METLWQERQPDIALISCHYTTYLAMHTEVHIFDHFYSNGKPWPVQHIGHRIPGTEPRQPWAPHVGADLDREFSLLLIWIHTERLESTGKTSWADFSMGLGRAVNRKGGTARTFW